MALKLIVTSLFSMNKTNLRKFNLSGSGFCKLNIMCLLVLSVLLPSATYANSICNLLISNYNLDSKKNTPMFPRDTVSYQAKDNTYRGRVEDVPFFELDIVDSPFDVFHSGITYSQLLKKGKDSSNPQFEKLKNQVAFLVKHTGQLPKEANGNKVIYKVGFDLAFNIKTEIGQKLKLVVGYKILLEDHPKFGTYNSAVIDPRRVFVYRGRDEIPLFVNNKEVAEKQGSFMNGFSFSGRMPLSKGKSLEHSEKMMGMKLDFDSSKFIANFHQLKIPFEIKGDLLSVYHDVWSVKNQSVNILSRKGIRFRWGDIRNVENYEDVKKVVFRWQRQNFVDKAKMGVFIVSSYSAIRTVFASAVLLGGFAWFVIASNKDSDAVSTNSDSVILLIDKGSLSPEQYEVVKGMAQTPKEFFKDPKNRELYYFGTKAPKPEVEKKEKK